MKTIATAVVAIVMSTATAWADEPQNTQTDEPIVLSEAEMDDVTAGEWFGRGWDLSVGEIVVDSGKSASWRGTIYVIDWTR